MVDAIIPPKPAKLAEKPDATARLESERMLMRGFGCQKKKLNDEWQGVTYLFWSKLTIMGIWGYDPVTQRKVAKSLTPDDTSLLLIRMKPARPTRM